MTTLTLNNEDTKSEVDFMHLSKGVGLATFWSGTLDAIAGVVVYDFALGRMSIIQVLQWIGSGVYGKESFNMGLAGAFYGMIFHYLIAFGFSVGLFLVYKKFLVLKNHFVFSGLAYGGAIWIVMNFIALPASNTAQGAFEPGVSLTGFIWHMIFVGLPIAYFTRKTFEQK